MRIFISWGNKMEHFKAERLLFTGVKCFTDSSTEQQTTTKPFYQTKLGGFDIETYTMLRPSKTDPERMDAKYKDRGRYRRRQTQSRRVASCN